MSGLLGEFSIADSLQPIVQWLYKFTMYIPNFIYHNPEEKNKTIPFSRKLHAAKQNEKGIFFNSLVKTQYFAGLSLPISLLYATHTLSKNNLLFCRKTEPVTAGTDATVYVWFLSQTYGYANKSRTNQIPFHTHRP